MSGLGKSRCPHKYLSYPDGNCTLGYQHGMEHEAVIKGRKSTVKWTNSICKYPGHFNGLVRCGLHVWHRGPHITQRVKDGVEWVIQWRETEAKDKPEDGIELNDQLDPLEYTDGWSS